MRNPTATPLHDAGRAVAYNRSLLSFDPAKDFEPITNVFFNTQALVVNASLNVKTVDELRRSPRRRRER
jgi:tripartite-type tricarboxylate transporter receptor subunit TctC